MFASLTIRRSRPCYSGATQVQKKNVFVETERSSRKIESETPGSAEPEHHLRPDIEARRTASGTLDLNKRQQPERMTTNPFGAPRDFLPLRESPPCLPELGVCHRGTAVKIDRSGYRRADPAAAAGEGEREKAPWSLAFSIYDFLEHRPDPALFC